jgi:hypothetical protein
MGSVPHKLSLCIDSILAVAVCRDAPSTGSARRAYGRMPALAGITGRAVVDCVYDLSSVDPLAVDPT